jgi:hypothetical protein
MRSIMAVIRSWVGAATRHGLVVRLSSGKTSV